MESSYYDILGIAENSSLDEIKRSYRRLTFQYHPDKNPDPSAAEKFKLINQAYEILSDPAKRSSYDLQRNRLNPGNLFANIFRNPNSFSFYSSNTHDLHTPFKNRQINLVLSCTLEEIYCGSVKKLSFERRTICSECRTDEIDPVCSHCMGRGTQLNYNLSTNGLNSISSPCQMCNGRGRHPVRPQKTCSLCLGERVRNEKVTLDFKIPMSVQDGQAVLIRGEGHQVPHRTSGDIIVTIKEIKHPFIERIRENLYQTINLELIDILSGFNLSLTHLDGKKLYISSDPRDIINHGDIRTLAGKGMAIDPRGTQFGNFILKFNVRIPKLSDDQLKLISPHLPPKTPVPDYDPSMEKINLNKISTHSPKGPDSVECHQQ